MKYTIELMLNKNREEVWKMFDSVENLYKWQPTLKEFSHQSGEQGQPGAVSQLIYLENKREMILTETITVRREPEEFSGTYEVKGTINSVKNVFREAGPGQTKWIMDSDFEFSGVYKLLKLTAWYCKPLKRLLFLVFSY